MKLRTVRDALLCLCLALAPGVSCGRPLPDIHPNGDGTRPPGGSSPLSIGAHCELVKDGRPYRAVGVNYYDAFYRRLKNPKDRSYRAGLAQLSHAHIPFIRFELLPHWPNEIKYTISHQDAFFRDFDDFIKDADRAGIGLVPSVFFNFGALPAAFGEPVSAWGDPHSQTVQFAKRFSTKLAARYRRSKTIWFWEFSNEINDWDDVPDAYHFYIANPKLGTPETYTPKDTYTSKDMLSAYAMFSEAIHAGDPDRMVEAGYNIPRDNASNRAAGRLDLDTMAQFSAIIARDNSVGQLTSVHVYPSSLEAGYSVRFKDRRVNPAQFVEVAAASAKAACRPLFLGEFGPDTDDKYASPSAAFLDYQNILDAFVASDGALAAMWAFDLPFNDSTNSTFSNSRANRLQAVIAANKRLSLAGYQ